MDETVIITRILSDLFPRLDGDVCAYFINIVVDDQGDGSALHESLVPFIESYSLISDESRFTTAESACDELISQLKSNGILLGNDSCTAGAKVSDDPQLLEKSARFSDLSKNLISDAEQQLTDTMWGFDKIRGKRNETIELNEAGSAKYERKAIKEQKRWLEELESKFVGEEDEELGQISLMTLPDLTGKNREKDIHVKSFSITFGGSVLLEDADLRIVYGRRFGLVGRNGVGKTTLLRHMANFDIEGFPTHHRILHVKQEVKASELSVLAVVLAADVERTALLQQEKELVAKMKTAADAQLQTALSQELAEVYDRMSIINCDSAEARASIILSGLRFTQEMQSESTNKLSGGWKMRVALAGALFIEPDLLMLDEPTNHLDLEAVLWLQAYLQTYKHSVLVVSHDRAFLNEICSDIILFKNQKLTYYRGNYDAFESARKESLLVQQRQFAAQQEKVAHMQEFVDKFRYNAKRASLVQSRIKAIEREEVDMIEAVEEDRAFSFSFTDAGSLGSPVIQIRDVTFGYDAVKPPLFKDVNCSIDLTSRIALVGPNGCGKSTLLNLVQEKLAPLDGTIFVNAQLRLGVFTQHHMDSFDLALSAVQNMTAKWPLASEPELRAHLGRYEIAGNDAMKPMKFMSGGQKSRVSFAVLTYTKPHVVILDEPTNHLDMEAIQALAHALMEFAGGVLVISHDQYFIKHICDEIWVVQDQGVRKFKGTFDDYKADVLKSLGVGGTRS